MQLQGMPGQYHQEGEEEMNKKKCNWCENTTDQSREDFHEIGWTAVQIGNKKMVCACPKHHHRLKKYMHKELGGQ